MEGVVAIVLMFGFCPLIGLAFSPVGKAFADRIRHGKTPLAGPEIDPAIYGELDQLRTDVAELQERVDFAERLLSKPGADTAAGGA
jgi:hypothetical protein